MPKKSSEKQDVVQELINHFGVPRKEAEDALTRARSIAKQYRKKEWRFRVEDGVFLLQSFPGEKAVIVEVRRETARVFDSNYLNGPKGERRKNIDMSNPQVDLSEYMREQIVLLVTERRPTRHAKTARGGRVGVPIKSDDR